MMINVAAYCNCKSDKNNVCHIDVRGALKKDEWADELHPFSKPFGRISDVYLKCILNEPTAGTGSAFVYPVRMNN
jgi:hypothetical protein